MKLKLEDKLRIIAMYENCHSAESKGIFSCKFLGLLLGLEINKFLIKLGDISCIILPNIFLMNQIKSFMMIYPF